MGQPSSATTPQANRSLAEANANGANNRRLRAVIFFGPDGSSNHMATNIQVDDDPSPPAMLAKMHRLVRSSKLRGRMGRTG